MFQQGHDKELYNKLNISAKPKNTLDGPAVATAPIPMADNTELPPTLATPIKIHTTNKDAILQAATDHYRSRTADPRKGCDLFYKKPVKPKRTYRMLLEQYTDIITYPSSSQRTDRAHRKSDTNM